MEQFSLFKILENLFSQSPAQSSPSSPVPPSDSPSSTPLEEQNVSEKNEPTVHENAPAPTKAQEAALDFLSSHETRANRIRKR